MTTYWKNAPYDSDVVLPSLKFKSAMEFLAEVKPPFYDDYHIEIINDDDNYDCFKFAMRLGVSVK